MGDTPGRVGVGVLLTDAGVAVVDAGGDVELEIDTRLELNDPGPAAAVCVDAVTISGDLDALGDAVGRLSVSSAVGLLVTAPASGRGRVKLVLLEVGVDINELMMPKYRGRVQLTCTLYTSLSGLRRRGRHAVEAFC